VRDDFLKQTITEIAKGVGYRCSNPDCARPTVAANAEQNGVITIGVAAHICAASPGGPRYNAAQTRETRRGNDNGIWLCQSCGKLIDADNAKYTVEVLTGWKRAAQERAFRELVAPGFTSPSEEATRIGSLAAADNASTADDKFTTLFRRVHTAASDDLAAYTRAPLWEQTSVELTLKLFDEADAPPFSISKLPPALEVAPEITLVAPPGTGKTTTVLQLARHVLAGNSIVPLYFRLGDVSDGVGGLLASLQQRSAFRNIAHDDLVALAERGRLLLVLDGWNELDSASRRQLRIDLDRVRLDWPHVRVVVTTRRQVLDVPISGPRISIELLSEDQQLAIARAQSGNAGVKIVDDAWRTDGVRELIATPLYLSALLAGASRGTNPTTKEEVLRLFVEQHERAKEHAETLNAALFGCHAAVLRALANCLNTATSSSMAETEARQIVAGALNELRQQAQIVGQPEPLAVLEVLTNHHVLTRSGVGRGTISFQHQQFQEWFASYHVADLMWASAKGDSGARVQLRAAILDQPAWEESVFFAAERVSREDGGTAIVAHAVRLALAIDPMLAAEMIYRSAPGVWETVGSDVMGFVDRWHRPGKVDRAVRFMIMTGRPEFAPRVWPLASSADSQIQLPTLRTAPRFRPSVLGPDLRSKIASLPDNIREPLLALIAYQSGVDGMELATEIAKADPSPKVQAEVVQYLQFRRADRHVANLLAVAHEETWALVAVRSYAAEISDPAIARRLNQERAKILAAAKTPTERLRVLLDQSASEPDRDSKIAAIIADPEFPVRGQQGGTSLYYAQERAPAAVLQGLRRRIEVGLELPFHADDFLNQLELTDDGPIAEAILDVGRGKRGDDKIAVIAGPKTTGALIDRFLERAAALRADRNDQQLYEEYQRLRSRIAATRPSSFVEAIMARANTDNLSLIRGLGDLVSSHGDTNDRNSTIPVDAAVKPALIGILQQWVEMVATSPQGTRSHLNEVSNAIGRFGFRELVPELTRLLDEELARLKKARDGFRDAQKRGDIEATSDARMIYSNQYQRAFSRIGGGEVANAVVRYLEHPEFGFEAALILKGVSDKQLNVPEPDFFRRWPWFDEVAAARAARATSPPTEPANTYANPIFAAIDRLARPENDKASQELAIKLSRIALAMPHQNQDALIARVMALPQPLKSKRELLAAMALDGQVLDANVVMQGIDEWLSEAATDAWQKRQNTWEIEPWLELLPYTTNPETVIEGLTKVKAFYTRDWAHRWERVLTAVAVMPEPGCEVLLAELARSQKDIATEYDWMKAILGRDTPSAVLLYVDLLLESVFGQDAHGPDALHVGRELAQYVAKFPQLRAEVKKRYESAPAKGEGRAMLEHLFGEIGDEDDLVAMVKKYAANSQAYDQRMSGAVRAVAVREVPVSESSNTFNIHPASVGSVRKTLFGLLVGEGNESELAKRCLAAIDRLRDEYGIAANDPRHPDVMSGKPWPQEVGPS
jgi:NACHT C-terminal Alpha/Beta 2